MDVQFRSVFRRKLALVAIAVGLCVISVWLSLPLRTDQCSDADPSGPSVTFWVSEYSSTFLSRSEHAIGLASRLADVPGVDGVSVQVEPHRLRVMLRWDPQISELWAEEELRRVLHERQIVKVAVGTQSLASIPSDGARMSWNKGAGEVQFVWSDCGWEHQRALPERRLANIVLEPVTDAVLEELTGKVCEASGVELGRMGTPYRIQVSNSATHLVCCIDCIGWVIHPWSLAGLK